MKLKVRPEVSSLDFANAVVLQGFRVPAITTRRTETEVELQDGQTFAVAGLMNNTLTTQMSKIPGIGDIPILGYLFRSKAARKDNTELVVMITPTILRRNSTGVSSTVPDMIEPFMPPPNKTVPPPAPWNRDGTSRSRRTRRRRGPAPMVPHAGFASGERRVRRQPRRQPSQPIAQEPAAPIAELPVRRRRRRRASPTRPGAPATVSGATDKQAEREREGAKNRTQQKAREREARRAQDEKRRAKRPPSARPREQAQCRRRAGRARPEGAGQAKVDAKKAAEREEAGGEGREGAGAARRGAAEAAGGGRAAAGGDRQAARRGDRARRAEAEGRAEGIRVCARPEAQK